jgi:hypothetical protein
MGTTPTVGDPEDLGSGCDDCFLKPYIVRVSLNIDDYDLPLDDSVADDVMTFYCSFMASDYQTGHYCPYAEAFGD